MEMELVKLTSRQYSPKPETLIPQFLFAIVPAPIIALSPTLPKAL